MRILIVEDEKTLANQLAEQLRQAGFVADLSHDGVEAAFLGATEPYDAIVLDLGLPGRDGLSVLKEWRGQGMACPVLILTARNQLHEKIEGLNAGADDYLTKPFSKGELLARVRALLRRAVRAEQSLLRFGDNEIDFVHRRVTRGGEEVKLTPIEYRLLCAMIAGQGRVLTHRQLLREVWGPAFADSAHYLRIYVGHLRHKLEAEPARPRHFITETGTGYRFLP